MSISSEHDKAAKQLKALLAAAPILAHFNDSKPLLVQCDSSKDGLGAVLMQEGHPLYYASRSLTATEQRYAQIEKELLSVVFAMEKFHQFTQTTCYSAKQTNIKSPNAPPKDASAAAVL